MKMYLHINKKCVIKNKDIIGFFSMETIGNTKTYMKLVKNMGENIIDLSDGHQKTLILAKRGETYKGYIIKLNINTIEKRILERK